MSHHVLWKLRGESLSIGWLKKNQKKKKKKRERENNFKSQDGYCLIDQGYFWQYILGHIFYILTKKKKSISNT
jgi:hypothetical protein